jgi:hypothetical protein
MTIIQNQLANPAILHPLGIWRNRIIAGSWVTARMTQEQNHPEPSQGLQKRRVVSSFIFKVAERHEKPAVALFKRSGKVRTYP